VKSAPTSQSARFISRRQRRGYLRANPARRVQSACAYPVRLGAALSALLRSGLRCRPPSGGRALALARVPPARFCIDPIK
jgi:hypothetical protein